MSVKRGAPAIAAVATPLPAHELREVVGAGEERVDRGAADCEEDADEREDEARCAERNLGAHGDRPESLGLDPLGEEERAARDHEREGEDAAEPVADHGIQAVDREVLRLPALFDRAGGVEVDLVRRHRGPEEPDGEVEVEERCRPC